jgi:cytochrome c551
VAVVDGTVYAGWGWWLAGSPPDADGGLLAFSLDGGGGGDPGDAGDGERGRTIYQQSCAACHGGAGEGASGPSLAGVAGRLTVEDHLAVVRDGRGNMPGWEGTLSAEEMEAVVEYERTVLSGG